MSNSKSKVQIIKDFNSLYLRFSEALDHYLSLRDEHYEVHHECKKWVATAFMKAGLKNYLITDEELKILDAYDGIAARFDISAYRQIPSYSWTSAFAVLRIGARRIKRLKKLFRRNQELVTKFIPEIKEMDRLLASKHMNESHPTIFEKFTAMKNQALSVRGDEPGGLAAFRHLLQMPFIGGWKMSKNEFLQLVTLDKDRNAWDGGRNWTYREWLERIPAELDSEAFERLIFIDKIEHDGDDVFFDIFFDEMRALMDRHKEETGESLIDPFAVFEEISGKPLQTFQVHTDEYGDVVKVEQNKPKLKAVEGGLLH